MIQDRPQDVTAAEAVTVVVGRVGRAHGLRGEVAVEVRTDDPDARFAPGAVLATEPPPVGPLVVAATRWHAGRLLLSFAGVEDRSAAETLRGAVLLVEVSAPQRPSDPDEYYDHQLVGLTVEDLDGTALGTVTEVVHLPAQDLLAVRGSDRVEFLVPFVAALVPVVDLDNSRVVVDLPAGLRPVNVDAGDG
jgi:16S rRNA processing protein RimM